MKNNLIVKSNQVVEAGYELTTNEQRLVLLGISKIPKEQDINPYFGYEITAQEYWQRQPLPHQSLQSPHWHGFYQYYRFVIPSNPPIGFSQQSRHAVG